MDHFLLYMAKQVSGVLQHQQNIGEAVNSMIYFMQNENNRTLYKRARFLLALNF